MFYCYMNDENYEPIINVLGVFCFIQNCGLSYSTFVRIFVGRPRFVVYPPRVICHYAL